MSSKFRISVTVNDPAPTVKNKLDMASGQAPVKALNNLANYINQMVSGVTSCSISIATTAVSASLSGTFTGQPTNADTAVINGVTFTAVTGPTANANEFVLGASPTAAATNFAAAINASVSAGIRGQIVATSAAGVITLTAIVPGTGGNLFTVTDSLGNFTWAGGATAFASGTEDAPITISHGL